MLSFSPVLSGLESLHSHRSTLESFGKKVDEKTKTLRAAELLFSAKKSDWDTIAELADELAANSDRVIILTEGLCEVLFESVVSICGSSDLKENNPNVELVSANVHAGKLKKLAESIVGEKVSLVLAFQNLPSDRFVWCFRVLLSALSQGRHPEEIARRVVVSSGQAASGWELWAQKSPYRTISFPHRCAGRYLFFSEPTALLLQLLGLTAWSYVEGGRSFFRQYDKIAEIEDPMFAYSALREVQLAEHHRETLVLPDASYSSFGQWWKMITEDSRKLFAEEAHDGLVWTGHVMQETASAARLHWVTEISVDCDLELDCEQESENEIPPLGMPDINSWSEVEKAYRNKIESQRLGTGYAQPNVSISLRRRDPFCLGGLFCFFECVVSASHRLAETSDNFGLCTPHALESVGAKA